MASLRVCPTEFCTWNVPAVAVLQYWDGAPALPFVSIDAKPKPALDESFFQQLLAAAYVVQEHAATLRPSALPSQSAEKTSRPSAVPTRSAEKLAKVAPIQNVLRNGTLGIPGSAKLVADNLLQLTAAAGVSVSLISNGFLDCVAESGSPASIPGSSIASHSLVATERLKAGNVFDSEDTFTDIRLDAELCKSMGVKSLLAVPVLSFGQLAGLIELRWDRDYLFQEADIAVCRLAASSLSELLEGKPLQTQEDATEPTAQAAAIAFTESAVLAQVPDGEDLEANHPAKETTPVGSVPPPPESSVNPLSVSKNAEQSCRICGRSFGANEAFCGFCSMPRFATAPAKELQSKWASLWYMQQAQDVLEERPSTIEPPSARTPPAENTSSVEPVLAPATAVSSATTEQPALAAERGESFSYFKPLAETYDAPDSDDIFGEKSLWSRLRGFRSKVGLKDAVLAVIATMLAFGVFSAWPSSSGGLTWFQSTMIRFGIYHSAARSPVYGNPDLNVWVDAQTAVYYCPGSEQYGNTAEGHFTTQREALQAHSQPASGLACQ
jgi:hypothetical protein